MSSAECHIYLTKVNVLTRKTLVPYSVKAWSLFSLNLYAIHGHLAVTLRPLATQFDASVFPLNAAMQTNECVVKANATKSAWRLRLNWPNKLGA